MPISCQSRRRQSRSALPPLDGVEDRQRTISPTGFCLDPVHQCSTDAAALEIPVNQKRADLGPVWRAWFRRQMELHGGDHLALDPGADQQPLAVAVGANGAVPIGLRLIDGKGSTKPTSAPSSTLCLNISTSPGMCFSASTAVSVAIVMFAFIGDLPEVSASRSLGIPCQSHCHFPA